MTGSAQKRLPTIIDQPQHPVTPDARYFVVRGKLWRMPNPNLSPARKSTLVSELMKAHSAVRSAKLAVTRGKKPPPIAPSMSSSESSASVARCGGRTERRILTARRSRILHMQNGIRACARAEGEARVEGVTNAEPACQGFTQILRRETFANAVCNI